MTPLIETIRKLHRQKVENNIVPNHVLYIDLLKEINKQVNNELNNLYSRGIIKITPTLNDKAIIIDE